MKEFCSSPLAYKFPRFGNIYLYKKKGRENLYLLLVSQLKALALPS